MIAWRSDLALNGGFVRHSTSKARKPILGFRKPVACARVRTTDTTEAL